MTRLLDTGLIWQALSGTSVKLDDAETNQITFGGKGNYTGSTTDALGCTQIDCGEFICDGTISGTYTVNPDGSGTATLTQVYTDKVNCGTLTGTLNQNLANGGRTLNWVGRKESPPSGSSVFTAVGSKLEGE